MERFTVTMKGQPVTFESGWRDGEVVDWLATHGDDFGRTLAAKCERWTPTQRAWAHYCVYRARRAQAQGQEAQAVTRGLEGIVRLFDDAAGRGMKYPKLAFRIGRAARVVQLSRRGERSREPGTVSVTDGGKYGSNIYYGRIGRDGATTISDPELLAFLTDFASDPETKAAEYGRASGSCCFCAKPLTDARSLEVGYGPKCAESYGLAWG